MKKTLFAIFAIASLAACSKNQVLETIAPEAISFNSGYVDNVTRSIDNTLNTSNLESFKVYGCVKFKEDASTTNVVNLYNDVEVKKGATDADANDVISNDWWYDGAYTQYWIEGNAYEFAAIVNGTAGDFNKDNNNANNMPSTISYDATTQDDLLYATYTVDSYDNGVDPDVVSFTFDHLLAKAQFTFVNEITTNTNNNKYTYKVTDIKITNAYMDGTYNIANKSWTVGSTTAPVTFGNITDASLSTQSAGAIEVGEVRATASATSHYSMLLIPHKYENTDKMTISYTIETLLNGVVIDRDENLKITPNVVELVAGNAYNFVFKKGNPGDVIRFELETVKVWDEDINNDDDNTNDNVEIN
jgi:hypothetical protein